MQVNNVLNEQPKIEPLERGTMVQGTSYAPVSGKGCDAVSLLLDEGGKDVPEGGIGYSISDMIEIAGAPCEEAIPGDVPSEEDEKELKDEGFSAKKFGKERLERAIARIKEGKAVIASSVEGQIEEIEETKKEMEEIGRGRLAVTGRGYEIARFLKEADLPVTKENIEGIERSIEMMSVVTSLSESGMAFLLSNELEPTVRNVYTAVHAGVMRTTTVNEAVMKSLAGEFDRVLLDAKELGAPSTTDDIRMLVSHDIPVTAKKLASKQELTKLARTIETGLPGEWVADACVRAIAAGKPAQEGVLVNPEESAYRQQLRKLIPTIMKTRELQETRLKLTVESGMRLYKEGIRVDTDSIEKVVEGLKDLEKQFLRHCLEETGEPARDEDVKLLKETVRVFGDLRESPEEVLGARFQKPSINVSELAAEGEKLKSAFESAGREYEKLQTAPRADLGDSIRKAFTKIDGMLESLNLEADADNRRAVKILGYNSIEINEKNINIMKEYDAEVRLLMDRMKPGVAAELIRRGIDPVNTPISELSEKLRTIDGELGNTPEERYSEFLLKAERSGAVSSDEREAFIGIYRLMYQIEKSDGAAIGAVVGAGQELTLGNLMTAVRTRKSSGIDRRVDGEFGTNEGFSSRSRLFTTQIEEALTRIVSEGTPAETYGGQEKTAHKMPSGEAREEVSQQMTLREELKEFSREVGILAEAELPDSLSYAEALRLVEAESPLLMAGRLMPKRPVKGLERAEISGEDVDEAELSRKSDDIYGNLVEKIDEEFEEEDLTSLRAKALLDMKNMMSLMPKLSERGYYELPVDTGSGMVVVSLMLEKGEDKGLGIRLTDEEYGVLEIGVKFDGAAAEFLTAAQTKEGGEILAGISREAKRLIGDHGFLVKDAPAGRVRSRDAYIEEHVRAVSAEGSGTDTGTLVAVAKGLIAMTVNAVAAADRR